MYKPVERRYITDDLTPLLVWIIIAVVFFCLGRYSMENSYNPRKVINNTDTLYYGDTAYAVRIYIDSALEFDKEYYPPDRRP